MRQKIERFANGIFSYDKPLLDISESEIKLTVISGKETEASFIVKNDHGTKVRGFCLCESEFVILKNETFEETENEIFFTFSGLNLDADTTINTEILIITECGEAVVSVEAEVVAAYIETSVGQTGNIFQYANLAISNPLEARDIFKTEDFKRIIIGNSPEYRNIYRNLSGASNTALVLEEFLIAAKKKSSMEFSINASKLVYDAGDTSFVDKILIRKNNWGYSQLKVEAVGDFIELERSLIWTEDFENNEFELKFAINPEKAGYGRNFGRIRVSTLGDEVDIPIECHKASPYGKSIKAAHREKQYILDIIMNQVEHELLHIDDDTFITNAESGLDYLKAFKDETDVERLYRIYLTFLSGKKAEAKKQFEDLEEAFEKNPDQRVYTISRFIGALVNGENISGNYSTELKSIYDNEKKMLSLLLYMKLDGKERFSKKQRFEEIKNCYLEGEHSIFGLIEGIRLLSIDPMLLREFSRFEIAVLREGLKLGLTNRLVGLQVSYVANREKTTSVKLIRLFKQFYEKFKQKELLEAVCTHLVLLGRTEPEDYEWLEMGVNEQLRIKGLYERCLEAADVDKKLLPRPLLNYFAAGDDLKDSDAAALYYNIVKFCEPSDNLYLMYRIRMETFAERSLEHGKFSKELALIYEKMLRTENLNSKCVASLPYILFKHEITTDWKRAVHAAISHKELREPDFVEFSSGRAIADIYTADPVIVLLDSEGNRCISSFKINIRKMINRPDLTKIMLNKCGNDKRVLLNRLESARYGAVNDEMIALYAKCVENEDLEENFLLECRRTLIDYYYDNLEGDLLENQLVRVDLKELSAKDRIGMMELMIFRELYNLALKNMEMFGFYGISPKRTARLCEVFIRSNSEQINSRLFQQLCTYSFNRYRQSKIILAFLEKNYEGNTQKLYDLWSVCHDMGIETTDLEERLLRTALFSENDMNFVKDVFEIYYGHCSSGKLVRAYLSYLAYGNLVCGNMLDTGILDIMRREANYSENDICTLTLLKNYSTRKSFTGPERSFIEYQIKKMESKGLIMPFFKDFPAEIRIPRQMKDKYYVEYHTDPKKDVRINYSFIGAEAADSFKEEPMRDIGFGIYIKEFVLFYGEVLQYFITENNDENNIITESREVTLGPEHFGSEECRYHHINLIITAKEMNDEKTVIKLIENYQFNDYAIKRLFEPIGG
ncbi:MAG: hypothetical protein IKZ73_05445 [Lachnospiraceae bacterium]|nr:hypothetical protein [Lachnospiraceae bacterium]